MILQWLLALSFLGHGARSFTAISLRRPYHHSSLLTAVSDDIPHGNNDDGSSVLTRREALMEGIGASLIATCTPWVLGSQPALASTADSNIGKSPTNPIVILGAGGKVGLLCAKLLSDQGYYVRATTRSGRSLFNEASPYLSYTAADVTKLDSVEMALKGASGVIFAASASGKKKGGEPAYVDYLGCYNTAKACLDQNVSKLVVVSAATVTRPDSIGFKATNAFVKFVYGDRIMDAKAAGEASVRDLYDQAGRSGYAIVRPGGLNDKASVGPGKIHISQGDVYNAEISRNDVALVTVAALLKGTATDGVTFELNQVEGLNKDIKTLPDLPPELVHVGGTSFDALLDGLYTDKVLKAKYPDLINDFRGEGLPPLSQLVA